MLEKLVKKFKKGDKNADEGSSEEVNSPDAEAALSAIDKALKLAKETKEKEEAEQKRKMKKESNSCTCGPW